MYKRLAFCAALAHVACVLPAPMERNAAIIGGEFDTVDSAIVVISAKLAGGGNQFINCSGALVSPHVVVTAAHCLDVDLTGPVEVTNVFLGADSKDQAQTQVLGNWRTGIEHVLDSAWQQGFADHDVGVLVLDKAVTKVAPVPLLRAPLSPAQIGEPLQLVGYGLIDAKDASSWGTRYRTSATLSGFDDLALWSEDGVHSGCEGDSGGAGLLAADGTHALAGVISGSLGMNNCTSGTKLSRIDRSLAFIDTQIAMYDPESVSADLASPLDLGTAPQLPRDNGCNIVSDRPQVSALFCCFAAVLVVARRGRRRGDPPPPDPPRPGVETTQRL